MADEGKNATLGEILTVTYYHEDGQVRKAAGHKLVSSYIERGLFYSLVHMTKDGSLDEEVRAAAERGVWEAKRNQIAQGKPSPYETTSRSEVLKMCREKAWKNEMENIEAPREFWERIGRNAIRRYVEEDNRLNLIKLAEDDRIPLEIREEAGMTVFERFVEIGAYESIVDVKKAGRFPTQVLAKAKHMIKDAGIRALQRHMEEKEYDKLHMMARDSALPQDVRKWAEEWLKVMAICISEKLGFETKVYDSEMKKKYMDAVREGVKKLTQKKGRKLERPNH